MGWCCTIRGIDPLHPSSKTCEWRWENWINYGYDGQRESYAIRIAFAKDFKLFESGCACRYSMFAHSVYCVLPPRAEADCEEGCLWVRVKMGPWLRRWTAVESSTDQVSWADSGFESSWDCKQPCRDQWRSNLRLSSLAFRPVAFQRRWERDFLPKARNPAGSCLGYWRSPCSVRVAPRMSIHIAIATSINHVDGEGNWAPVWRIYSSASLNGNTHYSVDNAGPGVQNW